MDFEDIVDTLERLLEASKDGEHGCRANALRVDSPELRQLLADRAEACRRAAAELQGFALDFRRRAELRVRAASSIGRSRDARGDADLEHVERTLDTLLESYDDALQDPLPIDLRAAIERHYADVKRHHRQLLALHERATLF